MKAKRREVGKGAVAARVKANDFGGLLTNLREVIRNARQQVVRAVDVVQVRTCWTVGRHIVEFEQGGAARAIYGQALLERLAGRLTTEFGKGFDASNLYKMSQFYRLFPKLDALRLELSWTHYRLLLRVEDSPARTWYMNEAANQNWGTRALDRQIGTLYYERLLASKDRKSVRKEASSRVASLPVTPRDLVRDPVMLEFLGLPDTGRLLESKELRVELVREQRVLAEQAVGDRCENPRNPPAIVPCRRKKDKKA